MLMIFIRHYPTYEFLSVIFNIDVSNVKRWIEASHKALGNVLVKKKLCPLDSTESKEVARERLIPFRFSLLGDGCPFSCT